MINEPSNAQTRETLARGRERPANGLSGHEEKRWLGCLAALEEA